MKKQKTITQLSLETIIIIMMIMLSTTLSYAQWTIDEGFEGGAIPAGWTTSAWGAYNVAGYPHTGDWLAASGMGNDWLITPQVYIQSGDSFIFWARAWNGTESFNVKLSTTGTAIGDFTTTLGTNTGVGETWVEYSYDLSSYTGNIYLAIEVISGGDYVLGLDDVLVGQESVSCPAPSGLAVSNITATTADLSWNAASGAIGYDWEVVPTGNGQGNGVVDGGNTAALTATATGLTASTTYDAYVQNDCGSGYDGPVTFTTACVAVTTFPFSENFDAAQTTPNCWVNDDPTEPWEFDTSCGHGADYDHTTGSGNFAWLDDSNPNDNPSNFDTPLLNVTSLTTPMLTFWYWIGDATTASTLYIDVFNGTSWTEGVASYTELQEWGEATVNISAYSSTTTQIRFRSMEDVSGYVGDICIDDVTVDEAPSCPNPSDLNTSGITQTTASLGWTDNAGASLWDIELGAFGFTPTGTPTQSSVTNPYTYGSLTASTTYDWYVRADCGGGDYSEWIGPISFTTSCAPYTADFSENFDVGITTPELPDCWSYLEISTSTFGYVSTSTTSSYSAPNNLRMYKYYAVDDLLLITPQLGDLTSQSNQIRFMGRVSGWAQDLIIGTMSDPTDETTFTPFQTIPITIFDVYEEYTILFDETYTLTDEYIAFKHGADINYSYLNIDDFVYEEIPSGTDISVNLTAFLEGPFNETDMNTELNPDHIPLSQPYNIAPWNYAGTENVVSIPNSNIVDWVLVELHDTTEAQYATGSTKIARQAAFLLNDGSIVDLDGASFLQFNLTIEDNLFVVIWHRNHLAILSANPLTYIGDTYLYNFSAVPGQAYGTDAQKNLGSGIYGMISGDVDASGFIDHDDKTIYWEPSAGTNGYNNSDLNLDTEVDNKDKDDLWVPNLNSESQLPE